MAGRPSKLLLPDAAERVRTLARNTFGSKRDILNQSIIPTIRAAGFRDVDEIVGITGAEEPPRHR